MVFRVTVFPFMCMASILQSHILLSVNNARIIYIDNCGQHYVKSHETDRGSKCN